MQFRILAVGKVKSGFLQEGMEHYLQRLKPYARVEILEVAEGRTSHKQRKQAMENLLADEAEKLLRHSAPGHFNLVLHEKGKSLSSPQFASYLSGLARDGCMPVNIFIGGAKGLHETIFESSHLVLSLSRLTFPHQLTRLLLLEQLYRCCKIIKNEPYHH